MSAPSPSPVLDVHVRRRDDAQQRLTQLDRRSAAYANARTVAFVIALALGAVTLLGKLPTWGWGAAVGALALFAALAYRHHRIFLEEERARMQVALSERGLARVTGRWHEFPGRGERFVDPAHLYSGDLDVFGQGSLFQLIDETATLAGEDRLAALLRAPADVAALRERQAAIRELSGKIDFRERVIVEGRVTAKAKPNPAPFLRWAEGGPYLGSVRWAVPVAWVLPPLTLAAWLLGREGLVPSVLVWVGLALHLIVIGLTFKALGEFYQRLSSGEHGFVRFEGLFAAVEDERFESPLLQRLQAGMAAEGARVSARLKRFSSLFSFAETRQSGQFHALLQLATLWDLHWLPRLEAWRRAEGPHVRRWFEALAELEALISLAGFAHDRPHFVYPTVEEQGPRYQATGLGHPLLDAPVLNDVALGGSEAPQALLITGSNMSGKTTVVRALGTNAVLALAGAPVCAASLHLSPTRIVTSMRVKDSLERGVSYFYAEVQRLKAVLDAAEAAKGQALFLLDEILLGTNTRERQLASREVLTLLLRSGAIGAVTTHDLALTTLEGGRPGAVRNVHFRDALVDGQMHFDYRLREGVVDTTNALRVLRLAGIPINDAPEEAP